MAHIIESNNELESVFNHLTKQFKREKLVLTVLIGVLLFSTFALDTFLMLLGVNDMFIRVHLMQSLWKINYLLFPLTGYFVLKTKHTMNQLGSIKSGVEGERKVKSILENLPDNYTVFQDVTITSEGKDSQIDNIVIGPNGIFVIETKNHKGKITGSSNDYNLIQYSKNRTNEFYNPIKQVSTHVFRTSNSLKSINCDPWVQGIVFFSNNEAHVCVDSEMVPVFASSNNGIKELINYIVTYENTNAQISDSDIKAIVSHLRQFINRSGTYTGKKFSVIDEVLSRI